MTKPQEKEEEAGETRKLGVSISPGKGCAREGSEEPDSERLGVQTEKCKASLHLDCQHVADNLQKELKYGYNSCLEPKLACRCEVLQRRRRQIPLYQLECVRLLLNCFPYSFCVGGLLRLSSYSHLANVNNVTK